MSRIRDLIFSNGERYPILMGEDGLPDYWVTLYVTEKLRTSHTQSAISNSLGHLIHLKLWERINSRDLISEFEQGNLLNDEDIYSIRDHCTLDAKSLKRWLKKSEKNVVKFASASTASVTPIQKVSNDHAANRMAQIAAYLNFLVRTILKTQLIDETVSNNIETMKRLLLANKPKGNKGKGLTADPNTKAPPPKAFERILSIVKETSPDNPFKGEDVKFRNAVIFEVMEATGMRAGEILALQIQDIDFQQGKVAVVRRHDAIEDPRKKQPVAKTNERSIPIAKTITDRLREYIMDRRASIPSARKHPYVFVTHKHGKYHGSPISNSTFVNRVLKPAVAIHPELLEEITRHGFRHNFNYRLSKKIDAINKAAKENPQIKPINEKKEIQIRKELNGWSSDKTAETYNLRHIREEADRVMREDMDHWTNRAKKDK
ncbi:MULTISPECIES: tyrosine-type recombinase/integrase [Shewanella]|uniref:tyrosine-type recombinase/integrase n=1 Tax=Shewanella TaxID=22 RepID=UPI0021D7D722|nr:MULTISPECIES: site-specific integrase [Shewanella]MCU8004807.1 site-specific integrase [Shewanella sp. SM96]MDI5837444.1 site-specific integrase [Shewanella xiamenensis]MDI5841656.1 site-specific integrase [Shewanella xiamenensis]MDI5845336.1 site-specific integrase [Shewanella xiamenensis]MDI5849191.1 site-specific integrase [Shewanella xiamenensis]